ncbi:hypothetical protein ACQWF9_26600, partial [Salmonella enterica subsp. enterica serovar Infantis]
YWFKKNNNLFFKFVKSLQLICRVAVRKFLMFNFWLYCIGGCFFVRGGCNPTMAKASGGGAGLGFCWVWGRSFKTYCGVYR